MLTATRREGKIDTEPWNENWWEGRGGGWGGGGGGEGVKARPEWALLPFSIERSREEDHDQDDDEDGDDEKGGEGVKARPEWASPAFSILVSAPSPPCWLKSPQQLHPNAIKMLLKILSHILHQMGIIYPLVQAKRREIEIILLVKKSTSFVEMSPESWVRKVSSESLIFSKENYHSKTLITFEGKKSHRGQTRLKMTARARAI